MCCLSRSIQHTSCEFVTEFRLVLFRSVRLLDRDRAVDDEASVRERDMQIRRHPDPCLGGAHRLEVVALDVQIELERIGARADGAGQLQLRSEEHTSELQSLMRISYAVFCLKKKNSTNVPVTQDHTSSTSDS